MESGTLAGQELHGGPFPHGRPTATFKEGTNWSFAIDPWRVLEAVLQLHTFSCIKEQCVEVSRASLSAPFYEFSIGDRITAWPLPNPLTFGTLS